MNSKMILLISILLLTACCGQQFQDPEEVFELIWENKLSDKGESIINSRYMQVWKNSFITTGDKDDPPTMFFYNTTTGVRRFEFISNSNYVNRAIYYNQIINDKYIGYCTDGIFSYDLNNNSIIWEIDLLEHDLKPSWGMTINGDYIYLPVSWKFGQVNVEKERMLKIHYLTGEMETVFELVSQDSLMYGFSAPVFRPDPESGHDIMYFNNQNWNYELSPQEVAQDMWAVDVETGEVLWCNAKFTPVASNGAIPPVHYGDAIITGGDWSIYSFDAKTGALNWKKEFPEYEPFALWG